MQFLFYVKKTTNRRFFCGRLKDKRRESVSCFKEKFDERLGKNGQWEHNIKFTQVGMSGWE
jgi:hypothetical protein